MSPWKKMFVAAFLTMIGASVATSVQAAIVMEKMLLAETQEAFEKGVAFPLRGESGADATYLSVRVYKWKQSPDEMYSFRANGRLCGFS